MKHHSIDQLFRNNQAWVAEKLAVDPTYFQQLSNGQTPPFLYIGCSDSRLALTKFTCTEPGELKDLNVSTVQWQLHICPLLLEFRLYATLKNES